MLIAKSAWREHVEEEDHANGNAIPECETCDGRGMVVMEDVQAPGKQEVCPACCGRSKSDDERREAERRMQQPWNDMFNAVMPFVYAMRGDRAMQDVLPLLLGDPLARVEDMHPWYFKAAGIALGEFSRLEKLREKEKLRASGSKRSVQGVGQ